MQTVLPYTTQASQLFSVERMKLLNPNSHSVSGPLVARREAKKVRGGVLDGWDADCAASAMHFALPGGAQGDGVLRAAGVQTWDLSWGPEERQFVEAVGRCYTPEEVEAVLPRKWVGYSTVEESDSALVTRVCSLCTALVDRFVQLSAGGGQAGTLSTAQWRQREHLRERIGQVMELLEAAVGESVPIQRLRDEGFVRGCWQQMHDDDRMDVLAALSDAPEAPNN